MDEDVIVTREDDSDDYAADIQPSWVQG